MSKIDYNLFARLDKPEFFLTKAIRAAPIIRWMQSSTIMQVLLKPSEQLTAQPGSNRLSRRRAIQAVPETWYPDSRGSIEAWSWWHIGVRPLKSSQNTRTFLYQAFARHEGTIFSFTNQCPRNFTRRDRLSEWIQRQRFDSTWICFAAIVKYIYRFQTTSTCIVTKSAGWKFQFQKRANLHRTRFQ